MELNVALPIIQALADGVDPTTGEVLPTENHFNRPDIISALYTAKEAIEQCIKESKRKKLPDNADKSWTSEEDLQLISIFDGGANLEEMSAKHARTKGSIAARLIRLGKISDRSEVS